MCFSPQADLVGGTVIMALGVDSLRHVQRRRDQLALASLPLLLGAHQIDEAFVWWGLQDHVPAQVGRVALWIFLVIAFVVLPVVVPLAVLTVDESRRRRWLIAPFVAVGSVVAVLLLNALVRNAFAARLAPYHLAYSLRLSDGLAVIALYVVAVCGSLLISGHRPIAVFGVANLVAVGVLALLLVDGFASLWCAWAAVTSAAIAGHLRLTQPGAEPRAQPR